MVEPMRIVYLVTASLDNGVREAREHGWAQIGYTRFVTSTRNDVRVISRAADLTPFAGKTPMLKAGDYEEGPPPKSPTHMLEAWIRNKDEFDRFVVEGNGVWIAEL
jgi:hypothetical protein